MTDQRKEPRRDYLARVVLFLTDPSGTQIEMPGMIEDRSTSGFGIRVRTEVVPGSPIRIKQGPKEFRGTVRRCVRSKLDYFIGIELLPDAAVPAPKI